MNKEKLLLTDEEIQIWCDNLVSGDKIILNDEAKKLCQAQLDKAIPLVKQKTRQKCWEDLASHYWFDKADFEEIKKKWGIK